MLLGTPYTSKTWTKLEVPPQNPPSVTRRRVATKSGEHQHVDVRQREKQKGFDDGYTHTGNIYWSYYKHIGTYHIYE